MTIFEPSKLKRTIDVFMLKFIDEYNTVDKKINSKTHDPILFAIDFHLVGNTFDWKSAARYQAVKQNRTNAIGDLHERLIDLIPDWNRLPHGHGQPDVINKKRKILIELKAREDTVKGSDLPGIYDNLERNLREKKFNQYTALYAHVLNKKRKQMPRPEFFTPSDNKQKRIDTSLDSKGKPYLKRRKENSKILRVDGSLLWSIILDKNGSIFPPYTNPNAVQDVYAEVFQAILGYKGKSIDKQSMKKLKDLALANFISTTQTTRTRPTQAP